MCLVILDRKSKARLTIFGGDEKSEEYANTGIENGKDLPGGASVFTHRSLLGYDKHQLTVVVEIVIFSFTSAISLKHGQLH